ncbi:MAG: hypothetical protein JW797_16015, partial [Bradymonadales bacterium]|nr:hypothetical protein [Bradymonadales bacterium]
MVEVPLVAQVLNDCGELGSAPLPFVPVRWNGRNARVRSGYELTVTDRYGLTSSRADFGRAADRDSSIIAVAGCVSGSFSLDVVPAEAHYLLMDHMDPVPVTAPDATSGVAIHLQLTDQYLNPVTGPEVLFHLVTTAESCMIGREAEANIAKDLVPGTCPFFDQFEGGPSLITYQTTDATGHYTTTISSTLPEDAIVFILPLSIDRGEEEPLQIYGRGLWNALEDGLEGELSWIMEDGSQWEVGTPEAGVGPGAAHSGYNCLGTNLDGALSYSITPRPDRAIYHAETEAVFNTPCAAFLQFQSWHDMGRPCPTDCTNAMGWFSILDTDDGGSDSGWARMSPLDRYPGPALCDEGGDIEEMPYWGFGGEGGGEWRTVHIPYLNEQCGLVPEEGQQPRWVKADHFASFNLSTINGYPLGPGWYIDDLEVTVLLHFGRVPFVPGPPEAVYFEPWWDSAKNLSETCRFPWIVQAWVEDYYGNLVPEATIDFALSQEDPPAEFELLAAGTGDAYFYEVLEGDNAQFNEDGTLTVDTSQEGSVMLSMLDDTEEWIRLDAVVQESTATEAIFLWFSQDDPTVGECCENAIDLQTITGNVVYSFYTCDYRDNQQILGCEPGEGYDQVLQFKVDSAAMYSIGYYCRASCLNDYVIELREGDASSCPGTPHPGTSPGDECQYGPRSYFLVPEQPYLLTIRALEPLNCETVYTYIGVSP